MKTRSNHFGGWRWRLRIRPWGTYVAASVFIVMFVCVIVLAVHLLTAEAAH